jgi:hypothetical protein
MEKKSEINKTTTPDQKERKEKKAEKGMSKDIIIMYLA